MSKRKPKEPGFDAQRVEFESKPGMQKLAETLQEVLKIPKAEIDKREADWKAQRPSKKC